MLKIYLIQVTQRDELEIVYKLDKNSTDRMKNVLVDLISDHYYTSFNDNDISKLLVYDKKTYFKMDNNFNAVVTNYKIGMETPENRLMTYTSICNAGDKIKLRK